MKRTRQRLSAHRVRQLMGHSPIAFFLATVTTFATLLFATSLAQAQMLPGVSLLAAGSHWVPRPLDTYRLIESPLIAAASDVYFVGDFETGDLGSFGVEVCCSDSILVVSAPVAVAGFAAPVRKGRYAAQINLRKDDPDVSSSRRAEVKTGRVTANSERWYAFSLFLPVDWETDASGEIVAQWHDSPDFDLGEDWRSPALNLTSKAGKWQLNRRWDPAPVTYNNTPGPEGGTETVSLGNYARGVWTDWVFHVDWAYDNSGLLEIWQNGKLVLTRNGPNTYNDQEGPYLKVGIYKYDWKNNPGNSTTTSRTLYIDEVRIGNASATYVDMSP